MIIILKKLTNKEWIAKAKIVHKNFYGYENTVYKKSRYKVIVTCPIHGDFEQQANSHLMGRGCMLCSGLKKLTTKEFIKKAQKIHGYKYDYSKSEYENTATKIVIICRQHGEFRQKPNNHVEQKHGCPECSKTRGWTKEGFADLSPHAYLYLIQCFNSEESFLKVGITTKESLSGRFRSKAEMPYEYEVIHKIRGCSGLIFDLEKQIHKELARYRYIPNLKFKGWNECFLANKEVLKAFNNR